jgi:16S rRNA (cytosine1402-N4)-methyltransferase
MTGETMEYRPEHISVMPDEVLHWLSPKPGGRYLDGTLGLAGHARMVLQAGQEDTRILGLDRDVQALAEARHRLEPYGERAVTMHSPYSRFEQALDETGWDLVDGALLDLGVSSLQLDAADRGFSFLREGPLDMRMDPNSGAPSAGTLVNTAPFDRLARIIGRLGEDPMAGRISRCIIKAREVKKIETTLELARIVEESYPAKWRRKARNHPATRTFQGLRMAVNSELEELEIFLERIPDRLAPGGRVVVISFHSLEDRLVKHSFRDAAKECVCPPRQPVCTCGKVPTLKVLTKKPVYPTDEETKHNSRARSAKLRAAERIAA